MKIGVKLMHSNFASVFVGYNVSTPYNGIVILEFQDLRFIIITIKKYNFELKKYPEMLSNLINL